MRRKPKITPLQSGKIYNSIKFTENSIAREDRRPLNFFILFRVASKFELLNVVIICEVCIVTPKFLSLLD